MNPYEYDRLKLQAEYGNRVERVVAKIQLALDEAPLGLENFIYPIRRLSEQIPPRLTRAAALASLIVTGLAVGAQFIDRTPEQIPKASTPTSSPPPTETEIPPTPTPEASPTPIDLEENLPNVLFHLDKTGSFYTRPGSDEHFPLPDNIYELIDQAQEQDAPILLDSWTESEIPDPSAYQHPITPEHPIDEVLPSTVMTEAELVARGIKIITTRPGLLTVDKAAFEVGGILEKFDSNHPVDIVLLDGPFVSEYYADDPVYDKVRWILQRYFPKESPDTLKNNMRSQLQERIAEFELVRAQLDSDSVDLKLAYDDYIILAKAMINFYESLEGDDITLYNFDYEDARGSWSDAPIEVDANGKVITTSATIFIATGYRPSNLFSVVYIDSLGQLSYRQFSDAEYNVDLRPSAQLSASRPEDYLIEPLKPGDDPKTTYMVGASDLRFVLYHELMHHLRNILGLNQDESETDADAFAQIEKFQTFFYWKLINDFYVRSNEATSEPS